MSNEQKTPLSLSLTELSRRKAADAIQGLGKCLPCRVVAVSGQIVTVAFDADSTPFTLPAVTIPIATLKYIRWPIQIGDLGITVPADVRINSVTGLGAGTPDMSTPSNLGALVFLPTANKGWSTSDDPNAVVIYGPNGAVIRDAAETNKIVLTPEGITITMTSGSVTVVGGDVIAEGVSLKNHVHSGVTRGGSDTDAPT